MRLWRRRSSGWWLAAWSCHLSAVSENACSPPESGASCLETPHDVGGVLTHSIAKAQNAIEWSTQDFVGHPDTHDCVSPPGSVVSGGIELVQDG